MKKIIAILMSLALVIFIAVALNKTQHSISIFYTDNSLKVRVSSGDEITATDQEGTMLVFLPSYCNEIRLRQENGQDVLIDGAHPETIDYENVHNIRISQGENTLFDGNIVFYHSANIYSMFVELDSVESAEEIGREYTKASIHVLDPDGQIDYSAPKVNIKGRGNSTFELNKRAYALKLGSEDSIADLPESKKYVLLSNGYEASKILNKLVFTILDRVGMEYTPRSQWVDMYINGDYRGNYLLCESIDIGDTKIDTTELEDNNKKLYEVSQDNHYETQNEKGYITDLSPSDITGGYIIEKDTDTFYEDSLVGFELDSGRKFTIKYPDNASQSEVEYIHNTVQNVENLLSDGDDSIFDHIDIDSFSRRWLVEELVLNDDATVTSYYFYKKAGDPKLYAGPGWDYDGTFGESNGPFRNYWETTLNIGNIRGTNALEWDNLLFNNSYYHDHLRETYVGLRPVFISAYSDLIDEYAETVRSSVQMDMVRWPELSKNSHYDNFDSTINYLKFFLYHRIMYLDVLFDISSEDLSKPPVADTSHTVTANDGDEVFTFMVHDGDIIDTDTLPQSQESDESYWYYDKTGEDVSPYLPVYEDVNITLGGD